MARPPMPVWRSLLRLAVRLSIAKTPERDRDRAALRAVFPAARFHAFADAGHGLALEQPEAWLRVVADFLREP